MSRKKRPKGVLGRKVSKGDLIPTLQQAQCLKAECSYQRMAGRKLCEQHTLELIEGKTQDKKTAAAPVRTRKRLPGALS